jgi:hypothetical protein
MSDLNEILAQLTPEKKDEVRRFAESLLDRGDSSPARRMSLSWAGALKEYRDRFTSLELQKKALEWWGD